MDSLYVIALVIVALWLIFRHNRLNILKHIHRKSTSKGDKDIMEQMARQWIGQDCYLSTICASDFGEFRGKILNVSDGALLLEDRKGNKQIINLEYIVRIRQAPQKSRKDR